MPREIQVKFASENCCKITNFLQTPKEIILLFTGFCTNMAFHAKSNKNMTHNLGGPRFKPWLVHNKASGEILGLFGDVRKNVIPLQRK